MECFNPIFLKERQVRVPCGKCLACLSNRADEWSFRITQELKDNFNAWFITLTYDEDNVPRSNGYRVLCKSDLQKFFKRLRKNLGVQKLRYVACGEYGPTTLRPHYHLIIFNFPQNTLIYEILYKTWKFGTIVFSPCKCGHTRYLSKYLLLFSDFPEYLKRREFKPFFLASKRPAIGSGFLTEQCLSIYRQCPSAAVTLAGGYKQRMPRYYRDKIYDDDMKAQLREQGEVFREKKYQEYIKKYYETDTKNYLGGYLTSYLQDIQKKMKDSLLKKLQKKSKL